MVVERFVANEFVAACWYLSGATCFATLYHDKERGIFGGRYNGFHESDEPNLGHGSHGRIPSNDKEYFKTDKYPQSINDGHYYKSYSTGWIGGVLDPYTQQVEGNLYMITDANGTTHYFSNYEKSPNHS